MSIIISPSLLACDFLNIEKELLFFKDFKNLWFHLDIMDGHFVPNLTFGFPIINKIAHSTNIPLDAHLMVSNPLFHVESYKNLGIQNITFHLESTNDDLESLISTAKKYYPSVGISIKPNTPISSIPPAILSSVDLLLIMSVEPGFGGQSFIESTYTKLDEIKKLNHNLMIQIDGGVDNTNASKLISHGATNLVAGSYIFKNQPYQSQVNTLRGIDG